MLITSFCANYEIDSEKNGTDALALLDDIDYDMAILEIDLLGLGGLEILKRMPLLITPRLMRISLRLLEYCDPKHQ